VIQLSGINLRPILLLLLFAAAPSLVQAQTHPDHMDCNALPCSQVLPGAARFDPVAEGPYLAGYSADNTLLGWVVLSTDVVDIKAYSGKPLITLVGLDTSGTIVGVRVVKHSEPILLVGIPESALLDFAAHYVGLKATAKVAVGSSPDPDAITVDVISGATVTALAQNQTILDTARELGSATGVVRFETATPGHFINAEESWSWQELIDQEVFGRLSVSAEDMGLEDEGEPFIDLWFTLADPPQVGRSLLGDLDYQFLAKDLKEGEHLLVVLGRGLSSFKGSAFVRGGIFDRVRLEQGLRSIMFHDSDYFNLPGVGLEGAPDFKEGAVFTTRGSLLDPGAPFELVFIGSRYDGRGGFSREFVSFSREYRLPSSLYKLEGPSRDQAIWRQAWYNHRISAFIVGLYLSGLIGLFLMRRWTTGSMARLKRLHLGALIFSFVGLGLWLHAQPSVTQILTLVDSTVHEFRWGLFLSEPLLFISWIFIALVSVIWGRGVFCGWACPYGALSELLFKLGNSLKIPPFELPLGIHRYARWIRYAILAGLVPIYMVSPELGERLAEVEPFKSTFFVAPWTREWFLFAWWLLLAGLSLVWYRPFCRYLCPLGAGLAIPSSLRRSGPRRRKFCSSCQICTRGCEPLAIRPNGTIDPRECLSCMECEANYRDDQVCPPLVGLDRLKPPSDGARAGFAERKKRLLAQVEDV